MEVATGYAASNEGGTGEGATIFSPTLDPLVNLNQNLKSLSDAEDEAYKRQQFHVAQNQKFLSALNPDLNGIFPGDRQAIVDKANELQTMGVRHLQMGGKNPDSAIAIDRAQNDLKGLISASKERNKSMIQAMLQYQHDPTKYDGEETNKNFATRAATPLTHLDADEMSKPLLVAKAPDVMTTLINEIQKIPEKESQSGKEKTFASGRIGVETITEKPQDQVLGVAKAMYNSNPQAIQKAFNNAPPEETAAYKVAADLTGGIAARMWYIDTGVKAGSGRQTTYKDVSYDPLRTKIFELASEKEKNIDPIIYRRANIIQGKEDAADIKVAMQIPAGATTTQAQAEEQHILPQIRINTMDAGQSLGQMQVAMPVKYKDVDGQEKFATTQDSKGNSVPLTMPSVMQNTHMLYANFAGTSYAMNSRSLYKYAQSKGLDFSKVIADPTPYRNDINAYEKIGPNYLLMFQNGLTGEEAVSQRKMFDETVKARKAWNPNGTIDMEKLAGGTTDESTQKTTVKSYSIKGKNFSEDAVSKAAKASNMTIEQYIKAVNQ